MPLDMGIGILAAIVTSKAAMIPLDWRLLCVAIVFSLLPDIDFAIHFFKKKQVDKFSHEHRDILHSPIPYILIGFFILSFWGLSIAWLFAALSFWHFLHDSIPEGGGWGIRWLYPFSKKYYKFFSGTNGEFAWHLVVSWTPKEQRQAAERFGNSDWARHYFRGPEFLIETSVLISAIIILIAFLK